MLPPLSPDSGAIPEPSQVRNTFSAHVRPDVCDATMLMRVTQDSQANGVGGVECPRPGV